MLDSYNITAFEFYVVNKCESPQLLKYIVSLVCYRFGLHDILKYIIKTRKPSEYAANYEYINTPSRDCIKQYGNMDDFTNKKYEFVQSYDNVKHTCYKRCQCNSRYLCYH